MRGYFFDPTSISDVLPAAQNENTNGTMSVLQHATFSSCYATFS